MWAGPPAENEILISLSLASESPPKTPRAVSGAPLNTGMTSLRGRIKRDAQRDSNGRRTLRSIILRVYRDGGAHVSSSACWSGNRSNAGRVLMGDE